MNRAKSKNTSKKYRMKPPILISILSGSNKIINVGKTARWDSKRTSILKPIGKRSQKSFVSLILG